MKLRTLAAPVLALGLMLTACGEKPIDTTVVWESDLPGSGVHTDLCNAELLVDFPVYYAPTREEFYNGVWYPMPTVKVRGQPVITFYGVTQDDIQLVFLENIDELYVDYDRTTPQKKIDYTVTEGDNNVSYYLETTYNYEFTVTTEQGSDRFQIINRRDVKYD